MKIYRISILLFVFVAGLVACNQKSDLKSLKTFGNKSENKNENENVGKKGDVVGQESGFSRISFLGDTREAMSLPNSLREVSGLSYDASANGLIAHDDELAILYHIDFDKREIKSKEKIGDIGDYEGVEDRKSVV